MPLDPDLHFLPHDYVQRIPPDYFVDEHSSGLTWLPDVYPQTLALADQYGRDVIIDLGCGRAAKLVDLAERRPDLQVVGVDYGANIEWCRQHHRCGTWVEADLESASSLPIGTELAGRSVVVCSDVLEHLVDPRPAMRLICRLLELGAAGAVLSTPAGDLRAGTTYLGPRVNTSHVRDWTQQEFGAFVADFPLTIERHELTRSDDGGGLTTQLLVAKRLTETPG